jgi:hypothetical protein
MDTIIACVPQVPRPPEINLSDGDKTAHYYDATKYTTLQLNTIGLGLNEALLKKAKTHLKPGGKVILNLGGRPSKETLMAMFTNNGYAAAVLHEEIIPQHAETSLKPLAILETEHVNQYEFFTDAAGQNQINAKQAEQRRLSGESLFHKIYVIEGRLLSEEKNV